MYAPKQQSWLSSLLSPLMMGIGQAAPGAIDRWAHGQPGMTPNEQPKA